MLSPKDKRKISDDGYFHLIYQKTTKSVHNRYRYKTGLSQKLIMDFLIRLSHPDKKAPYLRLTVGSSYFHCSNIGMYLNSYSNTYCKHGHYR